MSDVFISYAREDRAFARELCDALRERGIDVWWDFDLVGGDDFRHRIKGAIDESERVIVLWSERSVRSHFVIDEAGEAKRLNKLVPVAIDGAEPPLGFRGLHTVSVEDIEQDVEKIVRSLKGAVGRGSEQERSVERNWHQQKRRARPNRRAVVALGAAGAVAAVGAAGGYAFWPRQEPEPTGAKPGSVVDVEAERAVDMGNLRRTALVIGNANYREMHSLNNPPGDAAAIAGELEAKGFRVVLKTDVDKQGMVDAFKAFENILSVYGGVGVFHYAGNAVHLNGVDMLLPVDATYDAGRRELRGALNLTDLVNQIHAQTTKSFADDGYAVLYSASEGEQAADGVPGHHSPFTVALLDAFENTDGDLSAVSMHVSRTMESNAKALFEERRITRGVSPLRPEVRAPAKWTQTPYLDLRCRKPFHFNKPALDAEIGVMKILLLDACRDNPFNVELITG
ncbi:MAG: TIR domain-containing protein [Rhizobiaceae bacterium]|nr:TIR domain-containing protein [Rhizobiaceae bacterium]